MIFRQLFEPESFTYTYLLGCPQTGETVLIDPVVETANRDLEVLHEMGLKLTYTLETHVHADHVSGAFKLKAITDCKIAGAAMDDLACRDIGVREGETFRVGTLEIHPLFTPGHTDTHHAFLFHSPSGDWLFTGDALLIDACGRTDFQMGDASMLYRSIHDKFFSRPNDTSGLSGARLRGAFRVHYRSGESPQPPPKGQPQRRGFREADERLGSAVPEEARFLGSGQ